jgi:hypothetical protein
MYGLLSKSYAAYRINDTTNKHKKEGFWSNAKSHMSWPSRGAYYILEILLTLLSILCLYDCYVIKGWSTWMLILLLLLFFVPFVGDVLALGVIAYWLVECRQQSVVLAKLGVSV